MDKNGDYNEPNVLLLQNAVILQKIKILDDSKCANCKILWVNYFKPNLQDGFMWVHVEKEDKSTEFQFYSFDQNRMTSFMYQFSFTTVAKGFVGINMKNSQYIEIDGVGNTLTVCPFFKSMRFTEYENFKQDCVDRQVEINIQDMEYVDLIDYRDDGAVLITILSREDPLFSRQVWSYNATNIVPELDFEKKVYFLDPTYRFEFTKELRSETDLTFSTFETNSASYLLLNPTEKIRNFAQKNDGLSLTAKDDENEIEVTFDIEFTT